MKGEEKEHRISTREHFTNLDLFKDKHIIYIEDPFGKIEYEKNESLNRNISSIINHIKGKDIFVVITSREEVFKEFEKEQYMEAEFTKYINVINIAKPSYDDKKMKEMLLKWAKVNCCKWLDTDEEFVLSNSYRLPTPLSIKRFVDDTRDIDDKDELKKHLVDKSKETARSFAEEIEHMSIDKQVFLSFPFISEYFDIDDVRRWYDEVIKELKIDNAWSFDRVLRWFDGTKIVTKIGLIQFSHPSYRESLEYLLIKDGESTLFNENIFSRVLFKLSEKPEAYAYVAAAVALNFDKLSENIRNQLLMKLSENPEAYRYVAYIVVRNFDKLSEIREQLVIKLYPYCACGRCNHELADQCIECSCCKQFHESKNNA